MKDKACASDNLSSPSEESESSKDFSIRLSTKIRSIRRDRNLNRF